ncbi:hypothetical protein LTR41_007121 [Exophiala xenobiotica]|nr:hypothetical protein LTR41_007121 [Exophiala xenobiotica]
MPFYRFLNDEADMVTGHDWEELDETDSDEEPLGPESSPSPSPPAVREPLIIDIPSAESDDEEIPHEQAESRRDEPGEPDKRSLPGDDAEPRRREAFPSQGQTVRETNNGIESVSRYNETRNEFLGNLVSSMVEKGGLFRDEEQADSFRRKLISSSIVHQTGREEEVNNDPLKQQARRSISTYTPRVGRTQVDNARQRSENSSTAYIPVDVSQDGDDLHSDPLEGDIVHEWTNEAQRLKGLTNSNVTNFRRRDEANPAPLNGAETSILAQQAKQQCNRRIIEIWGEEVYGKYIEPMEMGVSALSACRRLAIEHPDAVEGISCIRAAVMNRLVKRGRKRTAGDMFARPNDMIKALNMQPADRIALLKRGYQVDVKTGWLQPVEDDESNQDEEPVLAAWRTSAKVRRRMSQSVRHASTVVANQIPSITGRHLPKPNIMPIEVASSGMSRDVSDDEEEDLMAVSLPFVQSDIPDEDINDKIANVWSENKQVQAIPRKRRPSTSGSPQLPLHYPCQFCRASNKRCDGYVPCGGCVKSGIGYKCVYRGGRGGGAISAKALGIKRPSRVKVSHAGSRYRASAAQRGPSAIAVASVSQRPPFSDSHSATSRRRQHPSVKSRSLASTLAPAPCSATLLPRSGQFSVAKRPTRPKVQMVNADPKDERLVICEPCRRGHSRCNGMLPCQRCLESSRYQGAQCVYRKEQYVSAGSTNSAVVASSVSLRSAPAREAEMVLNSTARPSSHQQQKATISADEWSDTDSDDEIDGDISHEEGLDAEEKSTIAVPPTDVPAPFSVRHNRIPPHVQYAGGPPRLRDTNLSRIAHKYGEVGWTRKRAASEDPDLGDSYQFRRKRGKLGTPETAWKPSGRTAKQALGRDVDDRLNTRLASATSTSRRRLYDDEEDGQDSSVAAEPIIRPEHVPSTIREVFANLEHDIVLDIMPDIPGRGRRMLQGLGMKFKQPWEYSTRPESVRRREVSENRSDLETILELRESADKTALKRQVRNLQQDPDVQWDLMTAQEQEQLKEKKYAEVMAQRDLEGRSANRFMQRVTDLAVSCVGEKAMLGFLLQSHKARKKVLGLLEDFCRLDEDGKLRLVAGGDGDGPRHGNGGGAGR